VLNGGPVISEFLAVNSHGIRDFDDDRSDWIELRNTAGEPVDLGGYFLTDDANNLRKWAFPDGVELAPREPLVVFASAKDTIAPNGELHTNFRLAKAGEFLGLVAPDGETVVSQFATPLAAGGSGFPPQFEDVAYGFGTARNNVSLVDPAGDVATLVPRSADEVAPNWTDPSFVDTKGLWSAHPGGNGVGFVVADPAPGNGQPRADNPLGALIRTDIGAAMAGRNASALVRAEFDVADPRQFDELMLSVRYDDGFVAYLNGTEIARRNAPAQPAWDASATAEHAAPAAARFERIPLTSGKRLRDFHATNDGTFVVDLADGVYDVTLTHGDVDRSRDALALFLEGTQVDTISTEAGQFVENTYRVEVADGQLTVRLFDQGGIRRNSTINSLAIDPVAVAGDAQPMAFDFGTGTSPVAGGHIRVPSGWRYAPGLGYGWIEGKVNAADRQPADVDLLQRGRNVLAIQGLNVAQDDPDFLLQFGLTGVTESIDTSSVGFLGIPTPGSDNDPPQAHVARPADFSRGGGTFAEDFLLKLSTDVPGAVIHYTTDRTFPTLGSPVYDPLAPIPIRTTTQVRTIVVAAGQVTSPVRTESFVRLADDLKDFTSPLPIVVLDDFEALRFNEIRTKDTYWALFEPQASSGRSALLDAPQLETRATVKIRGSSSGNFVKRPFRLEAVDDLGRDRAVSPLGLPADSDWILNARSLFDQSLLSNSFMYSLSNQMGRYAVRTRFVELFTNTDDGVLSQDDYVGVYTLMETIKRGPNRVDVEKLSRNFTTRPLIDGGYIFKIDRHDVGETVLEAGGRELVYVEPSEEEITQPIRQAQQQFLKDLVDQTVSSLEDRDPVHGYADRIDVDSWIDHHLLNVLAANGDGLNLSTYLFKRRDGKLAFGPIWDFDRSMGSSGTQPRGGSAGWLGKSSVPWWRTLFKDPDFRQRYADRYQQLRQGVWSTENINATIDALVAELTDEAATRNFERWPVGLGFKGWRSEVGELRRWLEDRVAWLDAQLISQPIVSQEAGADAGTRSVTLSLPEGAPAGTRLFYTLDGTDPRRTAFDVLSEANDQRRDLHQTAGGVFSVDLPNGTYEVTVVEGDVARPHDQMATAVEGIALGPPVSTSAGEFVRRTATVDIADGQLSLALDGVGGDGQPAVINGLEIVPRSGPQRLAFDFGPDDAPVAAGFTPAGAAAFDDAVGYGWTSGTVNLFDRGVPEDARRDLAQLKEQTASFAVRVPAGRYNVTVVMGDESRRLDAQLRLEPGESTEVSRRVTVHAGDHDRQGQLVEVRDGQLDLELSNVGRNTRAVINALIISPVLTFDFGTASSPVEPESIRVDATPYDPAVGYGWTAGTVTASDRRDLVEGGGVAPSAMEYTGGAIAVRKSRELRVRAFLPGSTRDVGTGAQPVFWSRETVVAAESTRPPLAITEINYHPEAPTADERSQDANLKASDFEFVELTNVTQQPIGLAGWQFAAGIGFTFPARTVEPGGVVLVVRNTDAFQTRYPAVDGNAILGEFSGQLSNGGENLLLAGPLGNRQIEFAYGDTAPWPAEADGGGATLILIDPAGTPAGDYGDAKRWQASGNRGGTPGHADLVDAVLTGDMDRDGDVDFDDIPALVIGLNDPASYESIYNVPPQFAGDFTGDGVLNMDDVEQLARLLVRGGA